MRHTFLMLVFVLLGAVARAGPIDPAAKEEVLDELQQVLIRNAYVHGTDFSKWAGYVRGHRAQIDRAATEGAFAAAVNEALREFGVSHVALAPPDGGRSRRSSVTIGIGANVRPAAGGLRVVGLHKDSGADAAGLAPGDIITHVDGKRVSVPEDLEGESGTTAKLRVRKVQGEVREVSLERRLTESRTPATYREVTAETALIRIPTFGGDYDPFEIEEMVQRAFWHDNLIIDLRGNGGGRVVFLLHLLSMFMPEGTVIGTSVSNESAARFVEETRGEGSDVFAVAAWMKEKLRTPPSPRGPYPGRVAVLIDGGSASASEMASSALRELRGAKIVGQTSAGALLGSNFMALPHGFGVQVPVFDYVTVKGDRPEGRGVKPDIEARRTRRGEDEGIAAAVRALEGL